MRLIALSVLSAMLAYGINTIILKINAKIAVLCVIPLIEESLKTGVAIWGAVSVWKAHLCFGFIEAFNDIKSGGSWLTAGYSVLSHSFFGVLTIYLYQYISLWLAIVLVTGIHCLWNYLMLRQ